MSYRYDIRKKTMKQDARQEPAAPAQDAPQSVFAQRAAAQSVHRVDLPDAIRARMENAFGADLSAVKLYESQAVADAGAEAVTQGSSIAFAPGRLDFSSRGGQALLGHELSHVLSQARGEVTGSGFLNDHALEARADREGAMAAAGQQVYAGPVTGALSGAAPAASSAAPMQAKRGGSKKAKAPKPKKAKESKKAAAPRESRIMNPPADNQIEDKPFISPLESDIGPDAELISGRNAISRPQEAQGQENGEEQSLEDAESLFRIQAGLGAGDEKLVSDEDKQWHAYTMMNASPALIGEILKRKDRAGVELMKQRRGMDQNNPDKKSGHRLNYDARVSAAGYDMGIYSALEKQLREKSKDNFSLAQTENEKTRSSETAADLLEAETLMKDNSYEETTEESKSRVQAEQETGRHLYQNQNLLIGGKSGNPAGNQSGEARNFNAGDDEAASEFFGIGNNGGFDQWKAKLKPEELTALTDYTGNMNHGAFGDFNEPLRKGQPLTGDLPDRLKAINNAMDNYELPEDLTVYRGVTGQMFGGEYDPEKLKKAYLGRTIRDKGFMSTSVLKGKQFKKGIQMKIRVPKGKGRGALLSPFSKYQHEHEFLIKNSSSFKVTNVYHDDSDDKTWMELEMVV